MLAALESPTLLMIATCLSCVRYLCRPDEVAQRTRIPYRWGLQPVTRRRLPCRKPYGRLTRCQLLIPGTYVRKYALPRVHTQKCRNLPVSTVHDGAAYKYSGASRCRKSFLPQWYISCWRTEQSLYLGVNWINTGHARRTPSVKLMIACAALMFVVGPRRCVYVRSRAPESMG
jgi:hypothetical protein